MTQKKEYYSITEAAEYLGHTPSWIYQLLTAGKLTYIKVGSFHMIPAAELRKYKRNHGIRSRQ